MTAPSDPKVRRLILSRALVAGAAGLIPVPYIDDLLAGGVRSALIRSIAELRNVDVDENGVAYLSTPQGSRLLNVAGMGALVLVGTKKAWKKIAATFLVVRRLDEAVQTYQVGMLFDRYCTQHHIGAGVNGDQAAVLRHLFDLSARQVRAQTLDRAFRRVLSLPGQAALRLWPFSKRAVAAGTAPEPVAERIEEQVKKTESSNFAHRMVDRLDHELGGVERAYLEQLFAAFDNAWEHAKLKAHETANRTPTS